MSTVKNILDRYELGWRIALVIFLTAFSFAFVLLGSRAALAMGIKTESVVTGDSILLGDIFYGLPHSEGKVLGPAPQPGHEMILNARTLMKIASALDLPWRPANTAEQVVLRSAAVTVSSQEIQERLHEMLKEKGAQEPFHVSFGGATPAIVLPQDEAATFEVGDLSYDVKNERYNAVIFAPSMSKPIQKVSVSGKVDAMTQIPVLRESLRAGTIIGQRDIDYVEIPSRELGDKTALRADDLIGATPRRVLTAGRPVLLTEVESPRMVKRGDLVTMVFQEGTLTLTAKGRALEHGAKGDAIRVVNENSSRTVEAIVTAEKEVTLKSYQ